MGGREKGSGKESSQEQESSQVQDQVKHQDCRQRASLPPGTLTISSCPFTAVSSTSSGPVPFPLCVHRTYDKPPIFPKQTQPVDWSVVTLPASCTYRVERYYLLGDLERINKGLSASIFTLGNGNSNTSRTYFLQEVTKMNVIKY